MEMENERMVRQLEKDAAFYYSVCLLRRLLEGGQITEDEYKRAVAGCAAATGSKLIVQL